MRTHRERLVVLVSTLAALAAGAHPSLAAAARRAAPDVGPASVDELLVRRGRPDLHAAGEAECLAYAAATSRDAPGLWYLFPRGGAGRARVVQALDLAGVQAVAGACGPAAAQYARIVQATCADPAALIRLLRSPELLAYRLPELPASLAWAHRAERGHLALAGELGCARVVTSRDGRARIWIPLRERLVGPDEGDPAGAGVRRGLAYVQWLDADGRVSVTRDRARGDDLHLDSVVDALEPLPGGRSRYLVTGIRSYDVPAPGALPRRYALVMELTPAGPALVREAFAVGEARRDLLLLDGPRPPGGQFRFHALRFRHLRLGADGALRLTPFVEGALARWPDGAGVATVARFDGLVFRVEASRFEATAERPGDARLWLTDRWGAMDDLGPRGFDEILQARGDPALPGDVVGHAGARPGAGVLASR